MTDQIVPCCPARPSCTCAGASCTAQPRRCGSLRLRSKASGPLLVIAADARQASRMEDELRFFCAPGTYIEHFPAWETLPYDLFSPHPDIVSQRLRMLSTLPRLAKGIVVVDLETALQRLPPQTYIDGARVRSQRRRSARRRGVSRAAERRRVRGELAGDGARRVRGARLDHRPVPDGQRRAVSHRSVRRRGREHPRVRSRRRSAPASARRRCACCRRANSR